MATHEEEGLFDEDPPSIDPYEVLSVSKTATPDEVKSAYRKLALKHHPDKVSAPEKKSAHTTFQSIVFAYSVLSDPVRRKRYDTTGSTAETLSLSDDFSWSDYYRSQFADVITASSIQKFSNDYKNSAEEKDAVLEAYTEHQGKWSGVYECVMLSNPLEDEGRYRGWIDEAIEEGEVEKYKAYSGETPKQKEQRMKNARKEVKEAMEYADKLGVSEKLFGTKAKNGKKDPEAGLAELIKSRQVGRGSFLDQLEAKYAAKEKDGKGRRGKKCDSEELEGKDDGMPSEEAFQAAAVRLKKPTVAADAGEPKRKRAKR
ncbi:putative DnaJ like protein subfamily C member 9 [Calycina marina]|uniref:DnaJ like protein subfamily C member 9 n=1 Tax=Calycina marina TaxID=1763456 RepID=A0A9P7Z667_9HELO|nr:putative DnaJ like protein subfamily C member 9 [Calycina marina]